jgi:hypothetical protein
LKSLALVALPAVFPLVTGKTALVQSNLPLTDLHLDPLTSLVTVAASLQMVTAVAADLQVHGMEFVAEDHLGALVVVSLKDPQLGWFLRPIFPVVGSKDIAGIGEISGGGENDD